MKAKVIETGEIVNVTPYPTWYKQNGQGPIRREWGSLRKIYEMFK